MQFLVETGADVSVVPPSAAERKNPQTLQLQAVNHTSISTYGIRLLTLNLGLRHTFRWALIVACRCAEDHSRHYTISVCWWTSNTTSSLMDFALRYSSPRVLSGLTLQLHEPAYAVIFRLSHSSASLTVLYCTMSHITFGKQVHPCLVRRAASLQNAFRSLDSRWQICRSLLRYLETLAPIPASMFMHP